MEGASFLKEHKAVLFLLIMYLVGITGHLIPSTRGLMISLTPFTLLLTGGIVAYKTFSHNNKYFVYWGIITYIVTFILEVVGVKTGLIFGKYEYGDILGFKLLEVPLLIGFNWVLVILGAISISKLFAGNKIGISVLAAFIAVTFDYYLEPVAIKFGYWSWESVAVPLQNYAAWFIIAFTFSMALLKINPVFNKGISREYVLIQLMFFVILNLFMR